METKPQFPINISRSRRTFSSKEAWARGHRVLAFLNISSIAVSAKVRKRVTRGRGNPWARKMRKGRKMGFKVDLLVRIALTAINFQRTAL